MSSPSTPTCPTMHVSRLEIEALRIILAEAESEQTTVHTSTDHIHFTASLTLVRNLVSRINGHYHPED